MTSYRFTFRPMMILLSLIFFSVFSALSAWQVFRVFEKQGIADQIEQANLGEPFRINDVSSSYLSQHIHYPAQAVGYFLTEQCFFVENVIRKGVAGRYLYCPFSTGEDNPLLLVNLGWMTQSGNRLDLPGVQLSSGRTELDGQIKATRSRPVVVLEGQIPNPEMKQLWSYFDFDYLQAQYSQTFHTIELQLNSALMPGLVTEWPKYEPKTGMHIGYAIHWAAFALVTLGLYLKFNFKKVKTDDR